MDILLTVLNYLCKEFFEIESINTKEDKIIIRTNCCQMDAIKNGMRSDNAKVWSLFKINNSRLPDVVFYNASYMSDIRLTFEAPLTQLIFAVGDFLHFNEEQTLKVKDFIWLLN